MAQAWVRNPGKMEFNAMIDPKVPVMRGESLADFKRYEKAVKA